MLIRRGSYNTLVVVVIALAATPAVVALGPQDNAAAIHRRLESMDNGGFRGQVILERDGVVALDHAYGIADGASGAAATPNTLYYIGSLAKMFTSAVVLQLDSEKRLSLSDSIAQHLDDVPDDKKSVTIRHLLTHTSGVVANHPDPFAKMGRDEFIAWFKTTSLLHAPGEKHSYSNVGYSLLAAIVETSVAVPFPQVIKQRVFVPAQMNDTWFVDELGTARDKLARGTGPKLAEYGLDGRPENYGGSWLRMGPGGIVSTTRDLLKWEHALRSHVVLDARQYALATAPSKPGEPWGMGWRLSRTTRQTPLHYHDGGLPGFHAVFARFPEERALIVILTNRDEGAAAVGRWIIADFFKP